MGFADRTVVKDRLRFDDVLFDEWSSQLNRTEAIEQMQEIGKALASPYLADTDFVVEGHTDDRGGRERNMRLSLGAGGIRQEVSVGEIEYWSATDQDRRLRRLEAQGAQ